MKPSSAKAKGRRLQQQVADDLRTTFGLGPDDVRSTPMGSHGEDVQLSEAARRLVPFSIECKNVEKLSLRASFAQAEANSRGHPPALVSKCNHSEPLITLRWRDALPLLATAHAVQALSPPPTQALATAPAGALPATPRGAPLASPSSDTSSTAFPVAPEGTAAFLRALADHIDG